MAAEHLLERGFSHFGFIGHPGINWSEGRHEGFLAAIAAAGYACDEYRGAGKTLRRYHQRSWEKEADEVAAWVRALPKPVGIMACNDFRAVQLLDACRRAEVAVPEEAAVIGVDDEDVACEMANPPLSSVVTNALHVGYEAASMLDGLMRGRRPPSLELCLPPTGIVARRSTDIMAITDPLVATAMQFIRQHACDGINVNDLLRHLPAARSVLQRRFKQLLNRTIHDAILGERIRKVKELLAETPLSLAEIAQRHRFRPHRVSLDRFQAEDRRDGQRLSRKPRRPRWSLSGGETRRTAALRPRAASAVCSHFSCRPPNRKLDRAGGLIIAADLLG